MNNGSDETPEAFKSVVQGLAQIRHRGFLCYHGIWDEGAPGFNDDEWKRILLSTDRKDSCVFWPYKPGALFSAASTMQERDEYYRREGKALLLTRIGLYIAGGGLLANVLLEIVKLVFFSEEK